MTLDPQLALGRKSGSFQPDDGEPLNGPTELPEGPLYFLATSPHLSRWFGESQHQLVRSPHRQAIHQGIEGATQVLEVPLFIEKWVVRRQFVPHDTLVGLRALHIRQAALFSK